MGPSFPAGDKTGVKTSLIQIPIISGILNFHTPVFNIKKPRVFGNFSRLFNAKKSYRIYFSKSYGGPGNLEFPLFEDSPVTKFDKLVLRAGFQDTRRSEAHQSRQGVAPSQH